MNDQLTSLSIFEASHDRARSRIRHRSGAGSDRLRPAPAPNMPLTPQAERLILRYAPEADLSVLTMKDYAVIRQMVYRKDYFWRKRSDIRAYIRANGG
ncbi:MAG: hypothetical protein JKP98_00025 [Rhodobacteraceae bacterium]|nr:hypothetical protein [Paracoccaceae bacterium]